MPTEVNTQSQSDRAAAAGAVLQTEGPAASAPDLTPAQVPQGGPQNVESVDIPKSAAPAPAPEPAKTADRKEQDRGSQPARMDASTLFEQVKGLPPDELDTFVAAIESELKDLDEEDDDSDVDLDEPSTSTGKKRSRDPDEPIGYSQLDVGSRRAIGAVHSHMVEQAIGQALDSDQELSYNMKQASPKAQESVKSIIRDRLQRLVDERGDRFDYNWGAAAKQAVAAEKARLTPFLERPARPGMGPGSQADFQVQRELKVPERVPAFADEQEYDEYLMERMRYNQALAEREQSDVPGA